MGLQSPVGDIAASCDQTGCSDVLRMIPSRPAVSTDEISTLFASLNWLYTPSKKVYCPKHKAGKK